MNEVQVLRLIRGAVAEIESDPRYELHSITTSREIFPHLKEECGDWIYSFTCRPELMPSEFTLVVRRREVDHIYPKPLRHIGYGLTSGYTPRWMHHKESVLPEWLDLRMNGFRWVVSLISILVYRAKVRFYPRLGRHGAY